MSLRGTIACSKLEAVERSYRNTSTGNADTTPAAVYTH